MEQSKSAYLSYHPSDAVFALQLAADLKNAGIALYIARIDANPNQDWTEEIHHAVRHAAGMIAVLSPQYARTEFTQNEITYAGENQLPLIGIILHSVPSSEIPAHFPRETWFDFRDWRNERAYRERLERLIAALRARANLALAPPDTELRYVHSLIALFEARKGILESLPIAGIDAVPNSVRPHLASDAAWELARRFTHFHAEDHAYVEGTPYSTLGVALAQVPRAVMVGAAGIGKTSMLECEALADARRFHAAWLERHKITTSIPLPIYLNLSAWDGKLSIEKFIVKSFPLDHDALGLLRTGCARLYLDGLGEMGADSAEKAARLRVWLHSANAPQKVLIACRTGEYRDGLNLDLPLLTLHDLDGEAVETVARAYLGENADPFLAYLYPAPRMGQTRDGRLAALARQPAALMTMIMLFKNDPSAELPSSMGGLFQKWTQRLWAVNVNDDMLTADGLTFTEVHVALGRLASSMIANGSPGIISRTDALRAFESGAKGESILRIAREMEILEARLEAVRFARRQTADYFAASTLTTGIIPNLLHNAHIDPAHRRVASSWDEAMILAVGIISNAEQFVREIAEIDPFLASECVVGAPHMSEAIYDETIGKLMHLNDSDAQHGFSAAQSLRQVAQRISIPTLLSLMRQGTWNSRRSAAWMLREVGAPMPSELVAVMRDWNWDMNDGVAAQFRTIGAEALPLLLRVLREEEGRMRRGAAWALGAIGDTAAVPALVDGLLDHDILVQCEAARALRLLGDPAATDSLLKALREDHRPLRRAAMDALIVMGAASVTGLIAALRDPDEGVRQMSAEGLGRVNDPTAVFALVTAIDDASPLVRSTAVEALGNLADPYAVEALVQCLADKWVSHHGEGRICDLAVNALRAIGTPEALTAVAQFRGNSSQTHTTFEPVYVSQATPFNDGLHDSDPDVRLITVIELGQNPDDDVIDPLIKTVKDQDVRVRHAAVTALYDRPCEATAWALVEALRDPEFIVVDQAARGLTAMGVFATEPLLAGLSDALPNVRVAAAEAVMFNTMETSLEPELIRALAALLDDDSRTTFGGKRVCDAAYDALLRIGTPDALQAIDDRRAAWDANMPQTLPEAYVDVGEDAEGDTQPLEAIAETLPPDDSLPGSLLINDDFHPISSEWLEALPDVQAMMETEVIEVPQLWAELPAQLELLNSRQKRAQEETAKSMRLTAQSLENQEDAAAFTLLIEALSTKDGFVRWVAAECLALFRNRNLVPALLPHVYDSDWRVRRTCLHAIAELGDSTVVPSLIDALQDTHPLPREVAAVALGKLGDRDVIPAICTVLMSDSDSFVRRAAAEALGEIGDMEAVDALLEAINDAEMSVRWSAVESLGKIKDPKAVQPLIALLSETTRPRWDVHSFAEMVARALVAIAVPEGVAAVRQWVRNNQLKV